MTKQEYRECEKYMLGEMEQDVHDNLHIYRVLSYALQIAKHERNINKDVLILACLLHDIGRREEEADSRLCHAKVGAKKATEFLSGKGYDEKTVSHVAECILTHRSRAKLTPKTIEGKILFDADKLDLTGTMGIVRSLQFGARFSEPVYLLGEDNMPVDAKTDKNHSLMRVYYKKLKKIEKKLYLDYSRKIAKKQKKSTNCFFKSMGKEMYDNHINCKTSLSEYLIDPHKTDEKL